MHAAAAGLTIVGAEDEERFVELSARNQLPGTITAITLGEVMADVTVDIGNGQTVVAAITRSSVERMGLRVGDAVVAVIKATEVMLGKATGA